jgi:hypothetical protein
VASRGTLALSWGHFGGFYLHRTRACLGWVALTYVPKGRDRRPDEGLRRVLSP